MRSKEVRIRKYLESSTARERRKIITERRYESRSGFLLITLSFRTAEFPHHSRTLKINGEFIQEHVVSAI